MITPRLLRSRWVWALLILALIIGLGPMLALKVFESRITAYVNGPKFLEELDKQTAKGLHFATGNYAPIKRTGTFDVATPSFEGSQGIKTFKTMEAKGITGAFNPWGIFLRRWQIDRIHIDSAQATIQTYEPKPPEKKQKPWYAIFMPDRVYLKEVICDDADITWKMRGKDSGFLGTRLLITPHGRDFEYRAKGGVFSLAPAPKLPIAALHMLVTKQELSLYEFKLTPTEKSSIIINGTAGLKDDKSLKASMEIDHIPIAPWISAEWRDDVRGTLTGNLTVESPDQKIEKSSGQGKFRVDGARLLGIPFLDYVASATRNEELKYLDLDEATLTFTWKHPVLTISDIRVEAKDAFRLRGELELRGSALSGTFDFGVRDENLEWLPKAREEIFTRSKDGYRWTKVRISGTLREPQNDLAPRIADVLKRSPGVATGLFFRQVGEWFEQTFSKE